MSAGHNLPTTDTGTVDCAAASSDIAPAYFTIDGSYESTVRIVGRDTFSKDTLATELKVAVSVVAGVLTIGPISTSLPLYAPNFPALAVTLTADPANLRVFVTILGDVGLAGRAADVDVFWSVWGEIEE